MQSVDFRDFILRALKARQKQTPGFPVSRFAAEIGMSAQKLNQVLTKKSGLSPSAAESIAKKLSLRGKERDLFIALVEAKHHRSKYVREAASERLRDLQAGADFDELTTQEFSLVSRWFHMAAAMLVDLEDFREDYQWIGERLGIDAEAAKDAYDQLFQMGLLREERGKWVRDARKFMVQTDGSDSHLQNYHRELMQVAEKTMVNEPVEMRHFSASMISLSKTDLAFARESIDTFRKKLINDISQRPGKAERIYGVSFQVFPVDKAPREGNQ